MDLPKENPPIDDGSEKEFSDPFDGFVSQPDEPAAGAASGLEPLLNLLAELNLVGGQNPQTKAPPTDNSNDKVQAETLGGPNDRSAISEEAELNLFGKQNRPTIDPKIDTKTDNNDEQVQAATSDGWNFLSAISQELAAASMSDRPEPPAAVNSIEVDDTKAVGAAPATSIPDSSTAVNSTVNSIEAAAPSIIEPFERSTAVNSIDTTAFSIPEPPARQTAANSANNDDTEAFLDGLKSLLLYTEKFDRSELENPDLPSQQIIDVAPVEAANLQEKLQPEPARSNLTETKNLEREATSLQTPPNFQEQPRSASQKEILGEIKQDLNEADGAIETLQNLIFGSKISDIEQVKNLLAENDLPGVRNLLVTIDQKLGKLEHQIYDPQELIQLMLPWIAQILTLKITESRDEVVNAIVPIIDDVILAKSHENKHSMSSAIAALLPDAISQQIQNSPADIAKAIGPEIAMAMQEQIRLDREAIAQALAPEMGNAIKAQIELERDAMVDALYPVIGNTIAKYMAEAIKNINEKVSNALSVEGVRRKIRSKVQGISEAELILRESIPFTVQAIFLIHKGSGLVISEMQQAGDFSLESEMVAGMLTAIRSFVNDCIVRPGEVSELNQIEYGDSKIILEVAGYCYLAVVIKGEPPEPFIKKTRETVSNLIIKHGRSIHEFEGDPDTISNEVHESIKALFDAQFIKEKSKKPPLLIAGLSLAAAGLIAIPWGIQLYRSNVERRLEANTLAALGSVPELAVYRLSADVKENTLTLTGKLPNQQLRTQAEKTAAATVPNLKLDNRIVAVDVPPDPVLVAGEVQRITAVLNQIEGVEISSQYRDRRVTVNGTVILPNDAQKIAPAFQKIPGVQSVITTVKLNPLTIPNRIYFESGSTAVNPSYRDTLVKLQKFLQQHPQKRIKIIGHSDRIGEASVNKQLALQRAAAVRDALILQGIAPQRLLTAASKNPPPGVDLDQPLLLSRCVVFEPITNDKKSK
ncbi:MAG: OmpA family protein [Oscillatoriaceae cyanobacterium Prado104]|jgi:outer membrane protein OmpA-like peptidoglycan-associated protein|nr:OmpA family protein [Oscillatoriaceae cyanobacterium Prado104]